jgi:hypothetical protein
MHHSATPFIHPPTSLLHRRQPSSTTPVRRSILRPSPYSRLAHTTETDRGNKTTSRRNSDRSAPGLPITVSLQRIRLYFVCARRLYISRPALCRSIRALFLRWRHWKACPSERLTNHGLSHSDHESCCHHSQRLDRLRFRQQLPC